MYNKIHANEEKILASKIINTTEYKRNKITLVCALYYILLYTIFLEHEYPREIRAISK
ncbi:MAG: hypothetical protein MRJ93_07615 [Nitrososphaeraceae archaeon]|nr:hypothetical protein [Nitrososphaeraceae archaeon]